MFFFIMTRQMRTRKFYLINKKWWGISVDKKVYTDKMPSCYCENSLINWVLIFLRRQLNPAVDSRPFVKDKH